MNEAAVANRTHKDSIFRLLFNDEEKIRELYGALSGEPVGADVPIVIRTLEDAVFLDIKNDLAFTIGDKYVVLIEHQSTVNQNMPVRMLSYVTRIFEKLYERKAFYRTGRLKLPMPEFYVFYNGRQEMGEKEELRLSESFSEAEKTSLELVVKILNVKYNKNREILQRCRTLQEYSILIASIEEGMAAGRDLKGAIEEAILRCRSEGVLKEFLQKHGSEVVGMLFDYVSREEYEEILKEDYYEQGRRTGEERGLKRGRQETKLEIAREMKENGMSEEQILKYTGIRAEEL